MKDYLSSTEREKLLMVIKASDLLSEMTTWDKRGTITKEERKYLKHALTLLGKSFESIIDRLNYDAKKTMANSLKSSYAVLTNEYGIKQYLKKKKADEKAAYEDNKEFFDLVEELMYQNCNGCLKDSCSCGYYKILERNYIGDMGDDYGRCRFAYKIKKEEKFEK